MHVVGNSVRASALEPLQLVGKRLAARVGIGYNLPLSLAMRIAADAEQWCRPVWILDSSAGDAGHSARLLSRIGDVVDLAGLDRSGRLGALRDARLDALVTYMDAGIAELAEAAEELGLDFETPEVAGCLSDKLAQRRRLALAGLPVPAFAPLDLGLDERSLHEAVEAVGFPAVLKPRHANGSMLVTRVGNVGELRAMLASIDVERFPATRGGLLLESYLPGAGAHDARYDDLVSVEMVVRDGQATALAVSGRRRLTPPFRECGLFIPAALTPREAADVEELAISVVAALGVRRRVLHIEIKQTPDGPMVIEVNGRPGGTVPDVLERAGARFSLTEVALRLALGEDSLHVERPGLSAVGYHMAWQPPVEARSIRSITGLEGVKDLPGVDDVRLNRQPGDHVDWRRGFDDFVFSVAGAAPDHEQMMAVVERVDREVLVEYDR